MTRFRASLLATVLLAAPASAQTRTPDAETFFEVKVRPVLAARCFKCHGGDKVSGGLRVDSRAALLKGGDSGPALVPGDPTKSLLIKAIRHTDTDLRMPQKKLPETVIADLSTWVKQGAFWPATKAATPFVYDKHWAFRPVKKVEPPPDPSGWAQHPIDRFLAAALRKQGLRPVGPAEPRVLLRRLTFDLTGLPPTPREVEDFLAESSAKPQAASAQAALEKVVERLLANPHYGERWGRHWLDVARYADTAGDNADYPIPEIRLYRDYVIDSFNADQPYDQFVREQLAGDLLARQGPPEKYAERVVATGFLALSRRYATAPYELWHLTLEDTIDTVGQAFLGLTLRCARCHDHKFDPVTQADYYALYGIFASTHFPYTGSEEFASMRRPRRHFAPLLPPEKSAPLLKAHAARLRDLEKQIAQAIKERAPQDKVNRLRTELQELQKAALPPALPCAYAVSEGTPADARLQPRGEPDDKAPTVRRGAPKFLAGPHNLAIPNGQSGRLQLADWVASKDNPLTARVMVNRIWQHHFGRGLVGTPNNFGLRGEEPTHPELLDWLAATFIEKGWSVKSLHRLIVSSKAYQLSSQLRMADRGWRIESHGLLRLPAISLNPQSAIRNPQSIDPDNRWYWRHSRRRLNAEAIRDALLAVSGTLKRERPGAHPFPPMAAWRWTQHNPFKEVYPSAHRSVYVMTQRIQRHPFLGLFDSPDTNTTTEKRPSSTVPLQALFLLNSPTARAEAEAFARRLCAAVPDARGRIRLAYELAYARPPRDHEMSRGVAYVERYAAELGRLGVVPAQRELEAWTSFARVILCSNEFVYVD